MRKNPQPEITPIEKRPRFESAGESNRFTFLQLETINHPAPGAERPLTNEMRLSLPSIAAASGLRRHPMRSRTPGLGRAPIFAVGARCNLADFFARRRTPPTRDGSRYDTAYRPAAIAARFLRYPLLEASARHGD